MYQEKCQTGKPLSWSRPLCRDSTQYSHPEATFLTVRPSTRTQLSQSHMNNVCMVLRPDSPSRSC